MNSCEYGIRKVVGLNNYIVCSILKEPCLYQRYCRTKERMIYTEGFEDCKVKEEVKVAKKKRAVKAKKNKKGIITLITNNYVIYEYDGNSCYKKGHFELNVGDEIEV